MNRLEQANHILQDCGLLNELKKYGTPHIIGSYKMNLMAWNDLDIDVENESMSLDKLYQLTKFILDNFNPTWYEAKEETNEQLKTAIIEIKEELINRNLYSFDKYTSMDVYDAVLNKGIMNVDEFVK